MGLGAQFQLQLFRKDGSQTVLVLLQGGSNFERQSCSIGGKYHDRFIEIIGFPKFIFSIGSIEGTDDLHIYAQLLSK